MFTYFCNITESLTICSLDIIAQHEQTSYNFMTKVWGPTFVYCILKLIHTLFLCFILFCIHYLDIEDSYASFTYILQGCLTYIKANGSRMKYKMADTKPQQRTAVREQCEYVGMYVRNNIVQLLATVISYSSRIINHRDANLMYCAVSWSSGNMRTNITRGLLFLCRGVRYHQRFARQASNLDCGSNSVNNIIWKAITHQWFDVDGGLTKSLNGNLDLNLPMNCHSWFIFDGNTLRCFASSLWQSNRHKIPYITTDVMSLHVQNLKRPNC